jgi:chromosome segregation ATPase
LEEDGLKIFQMTQTIDQKERLYTHIKDQVDDLSRQLESLQKSMLQREEDSANTIASLRKELKSQGKERKAMEQKLKDQRDLASSKQQDSLNQSKIVQDKDAMIKKLRGEIDKLKLQKEDLAKDKLMQDQRLGGLEQSILDLNGMVERCQREIDKNN